MVPQTVEERVNSAILPTFAVYDQHLDSFYPTDNTLNVDTKDARLLYNTILMIHLEDPSDTQDVWDLFREKFPDYITGVMSNGVVPDEKLMEVITELRSRTGSDPAVTASSIAGFCAISTGVRPGPAVHAAPQDLELGQDPLARFLQFDRSSAQRSAGTEAILAAVRLFSVRVASQYMSSLVIAGLSTATFGSGGFLALSTLALGALVIHAVTVSQEDNRRLLGQLRRNATDWANQIRRDHRGDVPGIQLWTNDEVLNWFLRNDGDVPGHLLEPALARAFPAEMQHMFTDLRQRVLRFFIAYPGWLEFIGNGISLVSAAYAIRVSWKKVMEKEQKDYCATLMRMHAEKTVFELAFNKVMDTEVCFYKDDIIRKAKTFSKIDLDGYVIPEHPTIDDRPDPVVSEARTVPMDRGAVKKRLDTVARKGIGVLDHWRGEYRQYPDQAADEISMAVKEWEEVFKTLITQRYRRAANTFALGSRGPSGNARRIRGAPCNAAFYDRNMLTLAQPYDSVVDQVWHKFQSTRLM